MQNEQNVEKAAPPGLCAAGCGFYSNVGTGGLCSKCYREQQRAEGQMQAATSALAKELTKAPTPFTVPSEPAPSTSAPAPSEPAVASPVVAPAPAGPVASSPVDAPAPKAPSSTRCLVCNKKCGLTGFACKCNPDAVFCSQHRYAEAHNCSFDYKAAQRQTLQDNNPLVQASKVQRL